jgi:signal transduction histidine kinase
VELLESAGDTCLLTVRFPLLGDAGELTGVCGVSLDVTARRQAEEEAHRLEDQFFALVSDELRTPLASIVGSCEVLRDDEASLSVEQRGFVDVVHRGAQRLTRLVGDLLLVAQHEAGTLALARGEVDLQALAARSVEAAAARAWELGVRVTFDGTAVAPLHGDAVRLSQAVDHLLGNACTFTQRGGHVEVRVEQAGDRAVVSVADTGAGIPFREQERVFDRFARGSAAAEVPGVGLGLAVVKAVAEAHGGRVDLRSRPRAGSTFTLALPLRAA